MNNPQQNKENQYPVPPFPKQDQVAPGRTSDMDPRPDHGEDLYVGNNLLKGKVAFITGGDSGIGKAIAIAMAREGADIAIVYLDDMEQEDAEDTRQWVEKAGQRSLVFQGDLRNENYCAQLIDEIVMKLGRLDILVNNAAYQMTYTSITEISATEWNKTFETNMSAMFYLCKHAIPKMEKGSSIINTTSVNAYDPNPSLLPYAATKGAIQNFTASLAAQLLEQDKGIRVNAVAPGPVWTPLIPTTIPDHEKFGANTPIGRPGQPAEIAPIYVFLASSYASYISGATVPATGGRITI